MIGDILKRFMPDLGDYEPLLHLQPLGKKVYVTGWSVDVCASFSKIEKDHAVSYSSGGTVHLALKRVSENVVIVDKSSLIGTYRGGETQKYEIHITKDDSFDPTTQYICLWVSHAEFENPKLILNTLQELNQLFLNDAVE